MVAWTRYKCKKDILVEWCRKSRRKREKEREREYVAPNYAIRLKWRGDVIDVRRLRVDRATGIKKKKGWIRKYQYRHFFFFFALIIISDALSNWEKRDR